MSHILEVFTIRVCDCKGNASMYVHIYVSKAREFKKNFHYVTTVVTIQLSYLLVPVLAIARSIPRLKSCTSSCELENRPLHLQVRISGDLGYRMVHCQSVAIVDSSTVVLPYVLLCAFDQSLVFMSQLKQRSIYFPYTSSDVRRNFVYYFKRIYICNIKIISLLLKRKH